MRGITLRTWNETPQPSLDFMLTTKITDLGEPLYQKSILGCYINFINNTVSPDTEDVYASYIFHFQYRLEVSGDFKTIATFTAGDLGFKTGNIFLKRMLGPTSIFKVNDIQLRIDAPVARGNISINDFGLIYRVYRSSSSSNLDER